MNCTAVQYSTTEAGDGDHPQENCYLFDNQQTNALPVYRGRCMLHLRQPMLDGARRMVHPVTTRQLHRLYRFTPTKVRSGGNFQLSELQFMYAGAAVNTSGATGTYDYPNPNEGGQMSLDGNVWTKTCCARSPITVSFQAAVSVDRFRFATGVPPNGTSKLRACAYGRARGGSAASPPAAGPSRSGRPRPYLRASVTPRLSNAEAAPPAAARSGAVPLGAAAALSPCVCDAAAIEC
eukprot:gene57355-biopygen111521